MDVFVVNDAERILRRISTHRDVINVLAFLKITGRARKRERLVRVHVLENDHRRRDGRIEISVGQQACENVSELFKLGGNLPNIFLARVANQ
jgi:hypothetical protein